MARFLSALPGIFFLQIVWNDSVMQFTHSQDLCSSKKCFFRGLPPPFSFPKWSFTSPLFFHCPASFILFLCLFDIWGPFLFFCNDWTFFSSTTLLLDSAISHPSCLSLWPVFFAAVFPGWVSSPTSPEVYHITCFPHFFPPSFYGGAPGWWTLSSLLLQQPLLSTPSGRRWQRGQPKQEAPVVFCRAPSLGKKSAVVAAVIIQGDFAGSSSTGWQGQASLCSAAFPSSSSSASLQPPCLPFLLERVGICEGRKLFAQTEPGKWHHDSGNSQTLKITRCWVLYLFFKSFAR